MSNHSPLRGESLKIIILILLGWSCFSFADIISKFLTQTYEPALLLAFTGIFSTTVLSLWILLNRGWKGFLSPNWKWLIARSLCIAVTATGVVNAVALIPLADLYGITFSAPFIAVFLAWSLLKEQVGWHRWLAVTVGFIGVFVLAGPKFETLNIGLIYAIAAAFAIAIGTIVIRKIGTKEYLPLFILYPCIGILVTNVPLALPHLDNLPTFPMLAGFTLSTLFVLGGQILTTYTISHAKATASIAPFVYVQVIWGVVFGFFIFGEKLTTSTIAGLILIIGAGLYMIYREKQLSQSNL